MVMEKKNYQQFIRIFLIKQNTSITFEGIKQIGLQLKLEQMEKRPL